MLDAFVDDLAQSPLAAWRAWALELAARVVDGGADIMIRRALFERVLFPALAEGLDEGAPGCLRWLAGLDIYLAHCPACLERLGPGADVPTGVASDGGGGRPGGRAVG